MAIYFTTFTFYNWIQRIPTSGEKTNHVKEFIRIAALSFPNVNQAIHLLSVTKASVPSRRKKVPPAISEELRSRPPYLRKLLYPTAIGQKTISPDSIAGNMAHRSPLSVDWDNSNHYLR
jgi:hypothetical protein